MEQTAIATELLRETAETVETLLREIEQELAALYDAAERMEQTENSAPQERLARDRADAAELCGTMRGFLCAMRDTCGLYDGCEQALCELIDAVWV